MKHNSETTISRTLCIIMIMKNKHTDYAFHKGSFFECCQTQITKFEKASCACYENIVTFQIPMNDGGHSGVKEIQSFQDLPTPVYENLLFDSCKPFYVSKRSKMRRICHELIEFTLAMMNYTTSLQCCQQSYQTLRKTLQYSK